MNISNEAVEAAAKAVYRGHPIYDEEAGTIIGYKTWEMTEPTYQEAVLKDARTALEAAAPFIRAEALEDLAKELEWVKPESSPCGDTEACCGSESSCDAMRPSVFVTGPASIRARAAAERGGE